MSKRLLYAAAVLIFLATARLHTGYSKTQDFRPATPEELAMTSAPSAPGAPAAILDWVRIDDDTDGSSAEYSSASEFKDGVLRYKRKYALQTFFVPRESLPELNQAFSKILADERANAVLR